MDKLSSEEQKDTAGKPKSARFWHKQLAGAKSREENWHKIGQEVVCRYLDDRDRYTAEKGDSRRVNILWSTTEVQKGLLFSRLGKPDVSRLFPKTGKDNKVARAAALVLERTLVACGNRYDPDHEITESVEDHLLPGRGVCWMVYTPTFEKVSVTQKMRDDETGEEIEVEQEEEHVTYQEASFEHVDWKDFRHGNAKKWRDVPWVGRPLICTKEDLERDYPEHADKIPMNYVLEEGRALKAADQDEYKRAQLWEIWDKASKCRIIIADDYEHELSRVEDPYKLQGFFPVPRPLFGVKTASSLVPRPEFLQWQDQAAELDRVNTRIWKLVEELKYCGVYDAADAENKEAFLTMTGLKDGQFLGIKNLRTLAQGGGLANAFQTRDLGPIGVAIEQLAARAVQLMEHIWQITGISDLMRGSTDPNETLGAQDHKARFGSQRQQQKQREVQRFVRDLYRMKAELIAEHFEREVLQEMSGIRLPLRAEIEQAKQALEALQKAQQAVQQARQMAQQGQQQGMPAVPPPADAVAILQAAQRNPDQIEEWQEIVKATAWEDVEAIIRSDDRRNYRIDVETDLTAMDETIEEKRLRVEFMQLFGQALPAAIQQSTGNAPIAALNREVMMHTVKGFKVARQLEEVIDDTFAKVATMPPPPNPQAEEAQKASKLVDLDMQLKTLQLEGAKTKNQELMLRNKEIEANALKAAAEIQSKQDAEARKQAFDEKVELEKLALERRKVDIMEFEAMTKATEYPTPGTAPQPNGKAPAGLGEAKLKMGVPTLLSELSQRMDDNAKSTAQQIHQLALMMSAPRTIVRDQNGEISQITIGQ